MKSTTIYLDDEATWPADVLDYLKHHHDLFLAWELRHNRIENSAIDVCAYDNAIRELRAVLCNYSLHGYHCTRLTETEIGHIKLNGMQLPNGVMLRQRIQLLLKAGLIESDVAELLEKKNQSDDRNRTGLIWFCFYPPHANDQWGIERFFRSWGGKPCIIFTRTIQKLDQSLNALARHVLLKQMFQLPI
ncbi:MAG: hypothetical protein WDM76_20070 [Limisphaerales bacterium]